ncbi:MAG: NAD+ synthase [Wolinella sp.]
MRDLNFSKISSKLVEFIASEISVRGFQKAILGLSGGLDSCVVSVLAKEALGVNFRTLYMPSLNSSKESLAHALLLSKLFEIPCEVRSIGALQEVFAREYALLDSSPRNRLRLGNACARFRMIILYDVALNEERLVIGTSNKSELALGYGTIYGDMAYALNPLGNLYKSEVFELARFLGIPQEIIQKPPSADFFKGQSDERELGFSYNELDKVLIEHMENRLSAEELLAKGYTPKLVDTVVQRVLKSQFKREMPPLASIEV